jgi:hypothetical protein
MFSLFGKFLPNLVSGQSELYMITPIDEHVCGDRDPLRSKAQWALNLPDEDGFASADGGLRDYADMLPINAMDWQVEEPRSDIASRDRLGLLRNDFGR